MLLILVAISGATFIPFHLWTRIQSKGIRPDPGQDVKIQGPFGKFKLAGKGLGLSASCSVQVEGAGLVKAKVSFYDPVLLRVGLRET